MVFLMDCIKTGLLIRQQSKTKKCHGRIAVVLTEFLALPMLIVTPRFEDIGPKPRCFHVFSRANVGVDIEFESEML